MEGVYAVLLVLLLWASAPEVANASRRYPYFPLTSEEEGPARQPLQTQRPFNIAHRGSNGEFPEATAGAYLVSDLVIFSISLPHDLSTYSINPKGLLWHRCFTGLPPHSPPSAWWHNIIGLHMKCKYCQFQQKWYTSETVVVPSKISSPPNTLIWWDAICNNPAMLMWWKSICSSSAIAFN